MNLVSMNNDGYVITLKEITDLIGVEHNKAMKKVEELALEDGFGGLAKTATPTYNPDGSLNRYIDTYQFTKKQAIAVGARLNNAMLMKVINRLEEMELSQASKIPQSFPDRLRSYALEKPKAEIELMLIEKTGEVLRLDDCSKLKLLQNFRDNYRLPHNLLPDYVAGRAHHSATELLSKFSVSIQTQKLNDALWRAGFLEKKTRNSKSGVKTFWSITEKGSKFGVNQVSPRNPNETQPHWYDDTFLDLLSVIFNAEAA